MRDACTSSNSLLEFRLGSIRPSGLKDIMIQTLAEWHMKDRAKGLPPLSELNQRPSKQGIQITVQHLERHCTAGQYTLDLRNGASKFLIQSAIQTAPSYYLTRHEHDSVITCRTTGTPRAGMLSWSSGGQIKKKLCLVLRKILKIFH